MIFALPCFFLCLSHVWCYIVFFFKQKTAYEMRISDWNSDVCSSDLARAATGARTGASASAAGRASRLRRVKRVMAGLRSPIWSRAQVNPAAQAALDNLGQIGRASCRERVCQYV